MLCTICADDCTLSHDLLHLRRELVVGGEPERDKLHATADAQQTRDEVFKILERHDFRIDATLLEKSKAQPQLELVSQSFINMPGLPFQACRTALTDAEQQVIDNGCCPRAKEDEGGVQACPQ